MNQAWLAYEGVRGSGRDAAAAWLEQDIYHLLTATDDPALGGEAFAERLHQVQDGAADQVQLEVPDPLGWETRWFLISARRLQGALAGVLISRKDVTALKQAELRVLEQRTFLNSILESSRHLGIVALDSDFRIALWNPAAASLLRTSKAAVLGRPFEVLDECRPMLPPGAATIASAEDSLWEVKGLPGKPEGIFENRLTRVLAEDGCRLGTVFTTRDITAARLYTQRMEQLNEELEAKVRARTRDLEYSHASLETAQQIAAVGSWDWDLTSDALTWSPQVYAIFGLFAESFSPRRDSLCQLAHADDRIRVCTAFSALGQATPRCDLQERVIRAMARLFCDTAGEPQRVLGTLQDITDQVRLMEAMRAAKEAAEQASQAKSNFLAIDTGIGIAKDKLGKIFERFSQADESTTRRFGGTGLGTALSKAIIETLGGTIWVESEEGVGSNFQFLVTLPEAAGECAQDAAEQPAEGLWTRPLRILLVEDNPLNQELVAVRLGQRQHSVVIANHGREALEHFQQGGFDLILMDVHMPVMDGLEATRAIRRHEAAQGGHIPIIVLSASVLDEDQRQCAEAGADAFVWKPIDFADLFNKIAAFFPAFQASPEPLAATARSTPLAHLPFRLIDAKAGLAIWRSVPGYRQALLRFGRDYGNSATRLQAIVEAAEPVKGVELLHALKGVSGNLGIKRLAALSDRLEGLFKGGTSPTPEQIAELAEAMQVLEADLSLLIQAEPEPEPSSLGERPLETAPASLDLPTLLATLDRLILALDESALDPVASETLHTLVDPVRLRPLEEALESYELDLAAERARALKDQLMAQS